MTVPLPASALMMKLMKTEGLDDLSSALEPSISIESVFCQVVLDPFVVPVPLKAIIPFLLFQKTNESGGGPGGAIDSLLCAPLALSQRDVQLKKGAPLSETSCTIKDILDQRFRLIIMHLPCMGGISAFLALALVLHAAAQSNAALDMQPGAQSCAGDSNSLPPLAIRSKHQRHSQRHLPRASPIPHQVNQSGSPRTRHLDARCEEQGRAVGHGERSHSHLPAAHDGDTHDGVAHGYVDSLSCPLVLPLQLEGAPPLSFSSAIANSFQLRYKRHEPLNANASSISRPFAVLQDNQIIQFLDDNELPVELSDVRFIR